MKTYIHFNKTSFKGKQDRLYRCIVYIIQNKTEKSQKSLLHNNNITDNVSPHNGAFRSNKEL